MKNKVTKMKFKFVTGTCPNCGGNKYSFDEKEQTFVCEFCDAKVYGGEPIEEKKNKVEEQEKDEETYGTNGDYDDYSCYSPMKRLTVRITGVLLVVMFSVNANKILCAGCGSFEQQAVDPVAQVDEAFGIVDDDVEDYTSYNTQMVFAIANDMYEHPSNYYQKKIKLKGKFATAFDESTQQRFYYCMVYDTTGDYNVALVFIPTDEMVYPDDYPEENGDITIQGMYSNNETYVVIKDAIVIKE